MIFFDAASGAMRPLTPRNPPIVAVARAAEASPDSFSALRNEFFLAALRAALGYLGYEVKIDGGSDPDLFWGRQPPQSPAPLWLCPSDAGAPLFEEAPLGVYDCADLQFHVLGAHYRAPVSISRLALEQAGQRRRHLRDLARSLFASHRGAAANQSAIAGYKKRLRDSLKIDFNTAAALSCLEDAVRPGALSPGSQLAMLLQAQASLGLSFL